MKTVLLFILLLHAIEPHIYSTTPKITYSYSGTPLYYSLYMNMQLGMGATDYLRLVWPEQIHNTIKTEVTVNLIAFSNNLQVATAACADESDVGTTVYHVTLGYAMQPMTWYEVQVYPSKNPVTTPINYLVQVLAVSTYKTNQITYDSNLGFGYLNILGPLAASNTLAIIGNSTSSQQNTPASIYSYDIYITPTVSSSTGGNFTMYIYYDSTNVTQATGTTINDFTFMGLCQSSATQTGSAAVLNYCSISSDLSTITFSVNNVAAGTAIRISTSVNNPAYYSIRGIKGYWAEFISGKVYENGFQTGCLSVNMIAINTVNQRVLLFWGIDATYTDSILTTALQIFRTPTANSAPNIFPYNSFNIGFSFSQSSPIAGQYEVLMTLNAQGILQGSIAHNLPAYSGLSVYCYYSTPNIVCKNVGAFINTGYRYFISGKAYFSASTPNTLPNFGAVAINPIVYSNSGTQILTPVLYTSLGGQSINVVDSQQLLDTTGYHNTAAYSIGNTQIVSYADDQTLSSLANGMQGFFTGTNSTIGIVPNLGTTQQLLLLLKTPLSAIYSGSNPSTNYTIQLMFNSYVIGFQSSAAGRGLDFVGYSNSGSVWTISNSPCYYNGLIVCEKYNNATPTINTKTLVNTGNQTNFYGMYNFQCGAPFNAAACTGNCASQCNMFTGYGTADQGSSVMSMRQITLPDGYFSPIYADINLLDFVLIFKQGASVISYALINGYTISGATMQNIKASYVNYYDNTAGAFNKGVRIPMMLRIGGGVLPAESNSATVIGVFFDCNIDASTFFTTTGSSWAVGCSTGQCNYFPNQNQYNIRTDNWLTNRMVFIYNIPPIQNQFNILIPVTPDNSGSSRNPPKILSIAFFTQTYTANGISGLLQTQSVFRLFGPTVTNTITGAISTINGIIRNTGTSTATPDMEMSANNFATYGSFYSALNTANMYSNPTNNTFIYGNQDNSLSFGTAYGAGYTITSFYYNIFASSTVQFDVPPPNTATTCTIFGYVYNEIQSLGSNAFKNGQWIYTAFCPIDAAFNLQNSGANINLLNPQYPLAFTNGFRLQSVLAISYSNPNGYLRAYRKETSSISTLVRTCTTAKLQTYNPSSSGKQRSTFTLTTPAITMSSTGYTGYFAFYVQFAIPLSTLGSSGLAFVSACDVSLSTLSCSIAGNSPTVMTALLTFTGTGTTTVTYLQINLYATTSTSASATFGTAAAYTVTVQLPQYQSATAYYIPFGSSFSGSRTTFCTCTSSFTVGITSYGQVMSMGSLNFNSVMTKTRSKISFTFGASSYRDAFFSSSIWQFNFGFLTNPNSGTYRGRSNFRCLVYQGPNSTSMTLSSSFATLTLSNFATAYLYPKAEIQNPTSILYSMNCFGGAVPDGTNSVSMTGQWYDGGFAVQTATGITYNAASYSSGFPYTATLTLPFKRFSTSGFKSLYSFGVSCNTALTSNAVFYFDFHFALSSYLDNEGVVQCYIRTAAVISDAAAMFTYCSFVNPWQLMVWNLNSVAANVITYVDIFNIDQPKPTDIGGNQKIGVTVDNDQVYSNGVLAYAEVTDTAPPASTAVANILILTASVDNSYILSTQTLTMTIDTQITTIFTTGQDIFVQFPAAYAQWIARSQVVSTTYSASTSVIQCQFNATGASTNLATACTFISQRMLMIKVGAIASTRLFTLTLRNIITPAAVPSGKYNQYRFKLFISDGTKTTITYYSFTDYSQALTLTTNPSLISLSWNYYSMAVSLSLITLTPISTVITIQIGYYANLIELRQSIYPSNFKATLQLTLNNYASYMFKFINGTNTTLGKTTAYFRIAAFTNTSAGLYTLEFDKTGDTNNVYTNIPPLTLVVQNTLCALTTDAMTYTLPIGGNNLPILINAINCMPISTINITVAITGTGNAQFVVNTDLSSLSLNSSSLDGQLYIVIQHTQNALVAGNSVTVGFTIVGSSNYATIPSVTLTLVDPTTFQTYPTATALSSPTLSGNSATFQLQCSQASLIYWGLGIYPSILNHAAVDFQARIVSAGNGLTTNFTEPNDYYNKVYGIRQGTTMQVLTLPLYQLESNTNYLFKYYCINQLNHISDSQSINFTSKNFGAYLMKVEVTFTGSITYVQYNQLACSMALNFIIPYTRVLTQAMSYCTNTPYIFYANDSSVILNQPDSSGNYIYGFYIEPDYSLSADTTNAQIRNQLSISSSATTIITSTANYINLPSLVQMQTYDIQIYTTPIISISAPISGLSSVVITASITNMNGFIIIGAYAGTFIAASMTIPSVTNIKQGLFSQNVSLLSVQMVHTNQNYNTSFQFTNLTSNTVYSFFYFCTVEDPSIIALSSTVGLLSAQTLSMLTIDINWGFRQSFAILSIILFLLL